MLKIELIRFKPQDIVTASTLNPLPDKDDSSHQPASPGGIQQGPVQGGGSGIS